MTSFWRVVRIPANHATSVKVVRCASPPVTRRGDTDASANNRHSYFLPTFQMEILPQASTSDARRFEPRKPTPGEKDELKQYLGAPLGDPDAVDRASIAVFDAYQSVVSNDSEKVMLVVWDSCPGHFDAYHWTEDGIKWLETEH